MSLIGRPPAWTRRTASAGTRAGTGASTSASRSDSFLPDGRSSRQALRCPWIPGHSSPPTPRSGTDRVNRRAADDIAMCPVPCRPDSSRNDQRRCPSNRAGTVGSPAKGVEMSIVRRERWAAACVGVAVMLTVAAATACGDDPTDNRDGGVALAGQWRPVPGGPLSARYSAHGFWTGDSVLVAGGRNDAPCPPDASCVLETDPPLRDGALFDPAASAWHRVADAPVPLGILGCRTAVRDCGRRSGVPARTGLRSRT